MAKATKEAPANKWFFKSRFSGLTVVANAGEDNEVSERFQPWVEQDAAGYDNKFGVLVTENEDVAKRCQELALSGDVEELESQKELDLHTKKAGPTTFVVS